MIGGIGICGLPLCCATFLNQFDGISISRAKNQMLTLNIPKLSGHCGKLICCLLFEDDMYTQAKADFPRLGTIVKDGSVEYRVDSYNILSRSVKLSSPDDYKFVTLDEYNVLARHNFHATSSDIPSKTPAKNPNGATGA
jgi:cell fate regulator YaaT (PSP1 superfamily)